MILLVSHLLTLFQHQSWIDEFPLQMTDGRMPGAMLNFGIHLDNCDPEDGDAALCLLPGTHRQSFFGFLFRKIYFIVSTSLSSLETSHVLLLISFRQSESPDDDEICVKTKAGDVTIHDVSLLCVDRLKVLDKQCKHDLQLCPLFPGSIMASSEAKREAFPAEKCLRSNPYCRSTD